MIGQIILSPNSPQGQQMAYNAALGQPAGSAAQTRLLVAAGVMPASALSAVGIGTPPATVANPQAGAAILGIPIVDMGIGAAVVGGLLFLGRKLF